MKWGLAALAAKGYSHRMLTNAHVNARFLTRLGAVSAVTVGLVVGVAATPATALPEAASSYSVVTAGTHSKWFPLHRSSVALGDSYTAGQGAPPYVPGQCLQSKYAGYPTIAALFSVYRLTENRACSGATIADTAAQLTVPTPVNGNTALVTLTVGAIDAGSNTVLAACGQYPDPGVPPCSTAIDLATQSLPHVGDELAVLYETIATTLPNARVAVLNYPLLFKPGADPLGDAINSVTTLLNEEIRVAVDDAVAATGNPKIMHVDVTQEFAGHAIGDLVPYIAYNPADLAATENFHPNALGNALGYARALASDRVFAR